MKKIFLIFLLGILLVSSCSKKGISFKKDDLDLFKSKLEENNFTVTGHYDEYNNDRFIAGVDFKYIVDGDRMYHEMMTTFKNEPNVGIITKVYSCIEKDEYVNYTYQIDHSGNGPEKTYVREESSKEIWEKNYDYGKDFVANFNQAFVYRKEKQYYTARDHNVTITFNQDKVVVTNEYSARKLEVTYSKFGTTKLRKPSFVSQYKKDEIIN